MKRSVEDEGGSRDMAKDKIDIPESHILHNVYCVARRARMDVEVIGRLIILINRVGGGWVLQSRMVVCRTFDGSVVFPYAVSKSQWERYDYAPVEERRCKKVNRKKYIRPRLMKPRYNTVNPRLKNTRFVDNKEIEEWLLKHNGLDFDSLDGLDGGIIDCDGDPSSV